MEDKKIVTTKREMAMAVAHASLLACEREENKDMKAGDIMRVTAYVSALVQLHLTGEKVFDKEEYEGTRMMFELAETLEEKTPCLVIKAKIRREP